MFKLVALIKDRKEYFMQSHTVYDSWLKILYNKLK